MACNEVVAMKSNESKESIFNLKTLSNIKPLRYIKPLKNTKPLPKKWLASTLLVVLISGALIGAYVLSIF
jgi:hypothetical protein